MGEVITIIVPIYKVEDCLHRCVVSILNQTYKRLEIILVNDGSPDGCGKICDDYAMLDERVKVIHKKNGGLSDARNTGIEIAQGEYISFVDSDDWIEDNYIEKLYQLLINTNSDISVCNFIRTSTEKVKINQSEEKKHEYSNIEALEQLYDRFGVQMVTAWGKLYKRKLFEGIRFPVGRIHEDEFTTYKLIYNAKKIALTTAQLLYYWQREDSIIGSGFNIKHRLDIIDAFNERAEFFDHIGLNDLRDRTYKVLFFIYKDVNKWKKMFENGYKKELFERNFKDLRKKLRESKQNYKFKAFYEMYFVAPKTMDGIIKICKRLRGD